MGTVLIDEPALWELAHDGDPAAFASLFDRHRDRVFAQALRLMHSPHDAEDVTAIVFLELWRLRRHVQPMKGTILGWLLLTTNHVTHSVTRGRRRYKAVINRIPTARSSSNGAKPSFDPGRSAAIRQLLVENVAGREHSTPLWRRFLSTVNVAS